MALRRGTAKLRALIRARRFVKFYVGGKDGVAGNAAAAALAGGLAKNENSATVQGHRYLHNPIVHAEIARTLDAAGVTEDRITTELARIAFGDHRDLAEWGDDYHRLVPSRLLDEGAARSVQGVSSEKTEYVSEHGVRVTTKTKVFQHDKIAALALLTKMRGMITSRVEHTGADGGPIEHAVRFYLPAPARARTPVVIEHVPQGNAAQNGAASPPSPAAPGEGAP